MKQWTLSRKKERHDSIFMKRVGIWIHVISCLCRAFGRSKARILDAGETIDYIVKNKKSVIRLGDGEFGIFHGKDIHYQNHSVALMKRLEQIITDYQNDDASVPYLLCVPYPFFTTSSLHLIKKRVYASCWAIPKYDFQTKFRQDIPYGDAFLFAKNNADRYPAIWKEVKNVVFVHHSPIYSGSLASCGKNVAFVEVPPQNAFSTLDTIEDSIRKEIDINQFTKEDSILLISAGPAGKIIAYDFSKRGYWCVDTGHCWDQPLEVS